MINKIVFKKVKIDNNRLLFFTFLFSLIFSNDFDRCIWVKGETLKEKKQFMMLLHLHLIMVLTKFFCKLGQEAIHIMILI